MSFGSSSEAAKEQIRRAIDIVELVGQHVALRREGRGFKGLCPWHDDSRPSLQVNPQRQTFRCYVCNIGGDIFSFVMKYENVTFPEALRMLAERAGIKLSTRDGPAGSGGDEKHTLYQAMAWAEQQFHECLLKSDVAAAARQYLESRRVSGDSIRRFRLGFAPDSWDWLLRQAQETRFTPPVLEKIGLVSRRQSGTGYYDRFRGRVLFSIRDVQGRPVGVGGRILPGLGDQQAAKYINSPETPLFSKSSLLYGLDLAKDAVTKSQTALVMEGYTDCLMAQQFGIQNAVAVLGTALGERHIRLLRRFAERIVLVLDGDEAGRRRTDQILDLFVAEQVDLRILTLPDELDPADFLERRGADEFNRLLAGAVDALEHKFRQATAGLDPAKSTHEANRALEQVLATLAKAPRLQAGATSAVRLKEDQILNRLAHKFGVGEERLRARLIDLRRSQHRPPAVAAVEEEPLTEEARKRRTAERWLMEILIQSPDSLADVRRELSADEFVCPQLRSVFAKCCELADAAVTPTFDRLLLEIDDPQLQSLLVELDEAHQALRRSTRAAELGPLLQRLRDLRDAEHSRAERAEAARHPASEEEQVEILRHIIGRKRSRQGISAPTDG